MLIGLYLFLPKTDKDKVCAGNLKIVEIMPYIRRLFCLAVENNFDFKAIYIKSSVNNLCDALSRLNIPSSAERILHLDVYELLCFNYIFASPLQV